MSKYLDAGKITAFVADHSQIAEDYRLVVTPLKLISQELKDGSIEVTYELEYMLLTIEQIKEAEGVYEEDGTLVRFREYTESQACKVSQKLRESVNHA